MNKTEEQPKSDIIRGIVAIAKYMNVSIASVHRWHDDDETFREVCHRKRVAGKTRRMWFASRKGLDQWIKD